MTRDCWAIDKMISTLYYKYRLNSKYLCINKECDRNRCLCLDKEQVVLMGKVVDNPCQLLNEKEHFCFSREEEFAEDYFCQEKTLCGIQLVPDLQKEEDNRKYVEEGIKFIVRRKITELVKLLPLIKAINTVRSINERDSISYLCVFGSDTFQFFNLFLLNILNQSIDCCLKNDGFDKLRDYMEHILSSINLLISEEEEYKVYKKNILDSIHQYYDAFCKEEESLRVIVNCIEGQKEVIERKNDFRGRYKDALTYICNNEFGSQEDEGREIELCYLYHVIKKTLAVMEQGLGNVCDKFFAKRSIIGQNHNIYNKLEESLEYISHRNLEEKKEGLRQLKEVVRNVCIDGEWCDEEVEIFYKKCINSI